jgi:hypothetical protein
MDFTTVRTNRHEHYKPVVETPRSGWRTNLPNLILRGYLFNLALVAAAYYSYRQFDYHGWIVFNAGVKDLYLSIFN